MKSFLLWLRIIRPQTLFASLCPVLVALMVVHDSGRPVHTLTAVTTALCALALQVLSNLINDYYDFRRGTDRKGRVGFKRALAEGLVSERQMLTACLVTLTLVLLSGLYLVVVGGWVILLIGLSAILFAWLYTATSHSLSYLGIADLFVLLYYGLVAGWGTGYLQTPGVYDGALSRTLLLAAAVNGLISMCVLMINNLRDIDSDREAGKRTFPVRFGKRAGEVAMAVVIVLIPCFVRMAFGSWLLALTVWLPALVLLAFTLRAHGPQYNRCLLLAGITNLCYTILVLASLLV